MLAGTLIYQMFLGGYEMRQLTYIGLALGVFSTFIDLWQILRINIEWGISDMVVLCFGSSVIYAVQFALSQLPSLVLFQKLTPPHVEATMMAFSASIVNMSRGLIGQLTGVAINKLFLHITQDDLSNYYLLPFISLGCAMYEFWIIKLIPVQSEIDACIKQRQE